jgi:hypothetical protein
MTPAGSFRATIAKRNPSFGQGQRLWPTGYGSDGLGWQGRRIFMDRKKEVFDAELYAIWVGLTAARDCKNEWATIAGCPKSGRNI